VRASGDYEPWVHKSYRLYIAYRGIGMRLVTSTVESWQATIHAFRQQPYVYSYRVGMMLLRSRVIRRLVRLYSRHLLKQTQDLVETLPARSIRDIITYSKLSKYHFTQLYALCRYLRPRVVVETGVGLGTSSLFILQALEDNGVGKLYSIDEPYSVYQSDAGILIDESAYCANGDRPGMLVPNELRDRWTLLLGKSHELLPVLCERLCSLDFFFHDSEHNYRNMFQEYSIVWPHLRASGVLASHDVEWNTAFQDFADAIQRQPIVWHNLGLIMAS